jgi:hypothetical protein
MRTQLDNFGSFVLLIGLKSQSSAFAIYIDWMGLAHTLAL